MDARIWHKAEHAVDLSSGAVLAITLQPASDGDTDTIHRTLAEAQSAAREIHDAVEEVVADKGYHSGAVLKERHHQGVRTYIPDRTAVGGSGRARRSSRSGLMRIVGECGAIAADSYKRGAVNLRREALLTCTKPVA